MAMTAEQSLTTSPIISSATLGTHPSQATGSKSSTSMEKVFMQEISLQSMPKTIASTNNLISKIRQKKRTANAVLFYVVY
jgi:hypothetical protein